MRFVRGGLVESGIPQDQVRGFLGGLGQLYGPDEAATLEKDVQNGTFQSRLQKGVQDRSFPNMELGDTISRTFAGIDAKGRLLVVTLGEGSARDQGGSLADGALLLKRLGAVEGYTLDGGGSTHMIVPGKLETRSDSRRVKSYLIVRSAA